MGGRFVAGATGWGGCVSLAGMKCRVGGGGPTKMVAYSGSHLWLAQDFFSSSIPHLANPFINCKQREVAILKNPLYRVKLLENLTSKYYLFFISFVISLKVCIWGCQKYHRWAGLGGTGIVWVYMSFCVEALVNVYFTLTICQLYFRLDIFSGHFPKADAISPNCLT